MINDQDPLVQLKSKPSCKLSSLRVLEQDSSVTSATCSFFAVATTLYRLWVRRNRYWIDDAAAAVALMTLCIQIVSVFLHIPVPNSQPQTTREYTFCTAKHLFLTNAWFQASQHTT